MKYNKGMFFTLSALLLLSLFILSYTLYQSTNEIKSTTKRVETLNAFLFSTEKDLERQIYIASFRTIFLLEDHITQTGTYVTNISALMNEGVFNGTLYGQPQPILAGATFSDIQSSIIQNAQKINANITLTNASLNVSQHDPWKVDVTLTVDLSLHDANDVASWTRKEVIIAQVPVNNFEDPLYLVGTNGLVTTQIKKTPYTPFVQGTNVSNLLAHTLGFYYTESTLAPSFLDRLQGQTTASPYGIESLVNLNELSSRGVAVRDKSVVDYIYFGSQTPVTAQVQGMPSWFKLDQPHWSLYQVSNLTF